MLTILSFHYLAGENICADENRIVKLIKLLNLLRLDWPGREMANRRMKHSLPFSQDS